MAKTHMNVTPLISNWIPAFAGMTDMGHDSGMGHDSNKVPDFRRELNFNKGFHSNPAATMTASTPILSFPRKRESRSIIRHHIFVAVSKPDLER
ncbi:hypothetical protein [Candidatus Magnetominusculus xianensis]|uniref:Uncharacterized protein n=1 Tax=Candidatus Magnetominusculus xianensis TaxID=1748249 RepID=A0ABR5SBN1_9BACT|nr:hypothetical protein [Candidatus Magnetominusculus xianensis]KWT73750.1 hypothetical protein ASN18_3372 [Candidatus Magnetominusculus xianensis]MBF0405550.1 hypothetical protein [Nitrospirota bacterium]